MFEKDLVIEITGQEGRRFWGTTTISGGGEKTDEPFIGELTGKDNRSFVFADTDGFWNGQLDGNGRRGWRCHPHDGVRSPVLTTTTPSCSSSDECVGRSRAKVHRRAIDAGSKPTS